MINWVQRLTDRKKANLFRQRRVLESPQDVQVRIGGQEYLSFCSNDYLGLANDPRVIEALKRGADQWGVGAGASHLITGHTRIHEQLEEELADFVGATRALLFSTGYMANLAIASSLASREATLFEDKLNHASLIDAVRLSRAKSRRYAHADARSLQEHLTQTSEHTPGKTAADKFIFTDAVFSMDGDLAPLPELTQLARDHNAYLVVDDAHGMGILGKSGAGTLEHYGIPVTESVILMATLGKALGVFGAFVAGDEDLIETLVQEARTYIYTTALPPAMAQALLTSLDIVRKEPERRDQLKRHVRYFRQQAQELGLELMNSDTPIQPLMVGRAETALKISEKLKQKGILVPAIRPPTVPEGSSRLRISFCARHSREQLDRLLEALAWALT